MTVELEEKKKELDSYRRNISQVLTVTFTILFVLK